MRRAQYFPMVVVGLAGFLGQTAMLTPCRAWNAAPAAVADDPFAPPVAGRIVDEAVQQAGYYDTRPKPSAPAAGIQPSTANRGAMYHGQKLKVPWLPFGRQSTTNKAIARVPQSNAPSAAPNAPNNAVRAPWRVAAQSPAAGRTAAQRMPAGTAAAASSNYQAVRVADGRAPQPNRSNYGPHPAAGQHPNAAITDPTRLIPASSNTTSTSPWSATPPAAPTDKPAATAPVNPAAVAPATSAAVAPAKPAAPLSPADRLVAEAHELSTHAQSEPDYTHVIETCRRAQASQASPATAQYAQNLIAWSLNRRGQLKAEAGQDTEAILDFDEAIHTDASCWRALHNRGVLLAQAGQFEKAFDDFSHTIQLNPQFAKAYSNRAALFMVADNLNAALADYKHAIELDANLAVAHRGCGRACQLLGRVDDAMTHYDAAVQLAPDDAYAAACRADLLTDIGRYSDAMAEYDRAIDIDPNSGQAQGGSAWLLATCPDSSIRNPELAIERAKAAIEQGGEKDPLNYDTLAAAQANAGDFDAAMESARTAIRLAPADECDTYKDRLIMYQQAKPYRIAPVERVANQVSYESAGGAEGTAR